MGRFKKAVCVLLIGILAFGCAEQFTLCTAEAKTPKYGKVTVSGKQDYKAAQQMLNLINKKRKKAGLSTLKLDKTLTNAAMTRAAELSVYIPQGSTHKRPNGKQKETVDKRICYENCLESYYTKGFGYEMTPQEAFNSWMGSSVHKKGILLSGAKSVGIACVTVAADEGQEAQFWVLDFSKSKVKSVEKSKKTVSFNKTITVLSKYLKQSYFHFETSDKVMKVGESRKMFLQYRNKYDKSKYSIGYIRLAPSAFKWTSGKPSVASVSKQGVVTAKKKGTAKITAKLKNGPNVSVSIKLTVKK